MRVCSCLWGGVYNPIIPVFCRPPKEWRPERFERVKGLAVAKGYVNFFEPDVFVESEVGLLEDAGLGALRDRHALEQHVISLEKFLARQEDRDWSEPAFGLSITDVFGDIYKSEQRFELRDKLPSVLIEPERGNGLVEAVFGAYPRQRDAAYFIRDYKDVFNPKELKATSATWLEVFKRGARTPLRVTQHALDIQRYWYHDLLVYVFDPARPTDLIDLWNLRLEGRPVLPVPAEWFESLVDHVRMRLKREHRPVRGNPHGVKHYATVEFARSIAKDHAAALIKVLSEDLPRDIFGVTHRRKPIWVQYSDDRMGQEGRLSITAAERRVSLTIKEGQELMASFETLAPEFASRFGVQENRWVNAVSASAFGLEKIATVLPFNLFDRSWPRLGMGAEWVAVGSEGWIFGQKYKDWSESLTLLTKEDAIIGSLKSLGIEAKQSDPGHIAKQMLDHLGGLWGVYLLADLETLQLLNKMAGAVRSRTDETGTIEETFERRTASLKAWTDLLARRNQRGSLPKVKLADFTKKNIVRLGLETDCPHCQFGNWHSLATADYEVTCERCLNRYDFPQAQLRPQNGNWHYRVVGPFSVPDYGRGSYSALLSLRVLERFDGSHDEMTFSTAMNLKLDRVDIEVDFLAWRRKERHGAHNPPKLVIGETKSLGQGDLIKSEDLTKLKAIGRKLPGVCIVISVLREHFTAPEKKLLQSFVNWGRRPDYDGQPTNPVILLTAHELFFEHHIGATWKALGKPYEGFADYEHTRNLYNFADATQRIYLDLPSFHQQQLDKWKKRAERKKKRAERD